MQFIILFLGCVFISSCLQLILKKGANKGYSGIHFFINKYTVIGYGIFFLITICTTLLYRFLDLTTGTMLDSCGYVFVILLSFFVLKEKITIKQIKGIFFIIFGVIISILI